MTTTPKNSSTTTKNSDLTINAYIAANAEYDTACQAANAAYEIAFDAANTARDEIRATARAVRDAAHAAADADREFAGGIADAIMDAIYETCRGNDVPVDAMTAIGREALRQASERNG